MSDIEKPKRTRRRSIDLQIQKALNDAEAATTEDISVQKLIQTRLNVLLRMQARENRDRLRELTDALAKSEAENARLRAEVEQLRATVRPVDPVISRALEKYHAENGGHHAGNNQSSSDSNAG